jgi:hypothetical protein
LFVVGIYLSVFPEPKRIFGLNFNVEGLSPQLMFLCFWFRFCRFLLSSPIFDLKVNL